MLSCPHPHVDRRPSPLLMPVLCALVFVLGSTGVAADASGAAGAMVVALQQPAGPAGGDFVPVDDLPAQERLPAAPLLIAAYVFVWAALLAYVFMLWRRLARVEGELASLSRQVDERRRN